MSADAFGATLHKLYAAAADFALWPEALLAIEELTGSIGAVIDFVPRGEVAPFTVAGRFTLEQCAEYARDYQHICRRIAFGLRHPDSIHCDLMILSETEMDRDPVYDWLGSHGLRYFVGGRVSDVGCHHVYFSLQRSPAQGHVQAGDLRLFSRLRSHMEQAISIADRLGTLSSQWRFSRSLLDMLPHAVFALAADGRISFANAAAERLLADGDGLTSSQRRLMARLPSEQGRLDRLLARATSPAGGWTRLSRRSGRAPYLVQVAPLALPEAAPTMADPKVVVLVHDLTSRDGPCAGALRQLYALTETEARVACMLGQGHDVASAAACLNVSTGTVRTHLKSVFRKMGLNRQQDLLRVLTRLAQSPMPAPPGGIADRAAAAPTSNADTAMANPFS